jgi:hypothetical protein
MGRASSRSKSARFYPDRLLDLSEPRDACDPSRSIDSRQQRTRDCEMNSRLKAGATYSRHFDLGGGKTNRGKIGC